MSDSRTDPPNYFSELRLVSWNVLAAPWASPQWYPKEMDASVLGREARDSLVAAALSAFDVDVMCLQETTLPGLEYLLGELGPDYELHFAGNGPELWSNWGAPETPWEPNGTAIVYRRARFTELARGAIDLGSHGNVACWLRLHEVSSDRDLQVVSLHLDSDDKDRRRSELPALFAALHAEGPVIIAGDYNEDTVTSSLDDGFAGLGDPFFERGFSDVFADLGRREPTHPYARPGDDFAPLAIIDHFLVRGIEAVDAEVIDAGVWTIDSPVRRIEELLRRTGADHLALRATVAL